MKRPKGTEAVFAELKKAAAGMRLVTYKELGSASGLATRGVGPPLHYIHHRLRHQQPGLPWLTAIVVMKGTNLPGDRFFEGEPGFELDLHEPSQRVWWRAMALLVFATDWSAVELVDEGTDGAG